MNVLIIGINGFLGKAIAATILSGEGVNVFGVSRSTTPTDDVEATYIVADRALPKTIADVVESRRIDVVVDVLAVTLEETQALISELDGHIAQYVMLSSSDVYRNYELLHRKAEGEPVAESVNEESPLRTTRYPYRLSPRRALSDPDKYLDEYEKITIEGAVRKISSDWTILRLPMVYGPGDKQRRFRWAIHHFSNTEEPLVLPSAWARFVSTYGYINNVAQGIALTLGNAKAVNAIYNVGESILVDHQTWASRIASVMNWPGIVEVSDEHSSKFDKIVQALDLSVPFRISSARIRRELGFQETVNISETLKRTVEDELARG